MLEKLIEQLDKVREDKKKKQKKYNEDMRKLNSKEKKIKDRIELLQAQEIIKKCKETNTDINDVLGGIY